MINSLAALLTKQYPDYPVYDSPKPAGDEIPCFFIFFMPSTTEEHAGNRYYRDLGVDIVFVQQRNLVNGNQKIQEIAEFLDRPWIHSGMQIIAIFAHFFLPVNGSGTLKMKSCITSFIYVREWHCRRKKISCLIWRKMTLESKKTGKMSEKKYSTEKL